jgi:hypothetical protein
MKDSNPLHINHMSEDDIIEMLEQLEIEADNEAGMETEKEDEVPAVEIRPITLRLYGSGKPCAGRQ